MIIAIDGPAGSGKTTVSKLLAKKINIFYLDTGAIYRVLTLKALQENVNLVDEDKLAYLADHLALRFYGDKVLLEGDDVTAKIRELQIDKNISQVVSWEKVRSEMVRFQRDIVKGRDAVVEGRDIATVVFPEAEYKFYLDADVNQRAKRRQRELIKRGIKISLKEVGSQICRRDNCDINREIGPLTIGKDAIYLDTTNLTIEEVLKTILSYIKNGR